MATGARYPQPGGFSPNQLIHQTFRKIRLGIDGEGDAGRWQLTTVPLLRMEDGISGQAARGVLLGRERGSLGFSRHEPPMDGRSYFRGRSWTSFASSRSCAGTRRILGFSPSTRSTNVPRSGEVEYRAARSPF